MNISKELQEKISVLLNEELKEKILGGDVEAIRQIGIMSQKGINPEEIVYAYEKKDTETMENLYKKAKRLVELQKVYRGLCMAHCEENIENDEVR